MRKVMLMTSALMMLATVVLPARADSPGFGLHRGADPLVFQTDIDGNPAQVEIFLEQGTNPGAAVQMVCGSQKCMKQTTPDEPVSLAGYEWLQFLDRGRRNDSVTQSYNPNGDPSGSAGLGALQRAQDTWSRVKGSTFRFAFGGTTTRCPSSVVSFLVRSGFSTPCATNQAGLDGYNDVGWLPLPHGVLGITITTFRRPPLNTPNTARAIIEEDIAISTSSQAFDAESILLHEEGHFAGFNHNPDPNSVMFAALAPSQIKRALTDSETDGLAFLYPKKRSALAFEALKFNFTDVTCPGSLLTVPLGINSFGDIVGYVRMPADQSRHAVLIKWGQCIPLAPILNTYFSLALKINDRGDTVGYFADDAGITHGFFVSGGGVLTQLDFPGAAATVAFGINQLGIVVGSFDSYDSQGNFIATHGFTWNGRTFTQVDYPDSGDTYLYGINDSGDLVGGYDSGPLATNEHGFVRTSGKYISFDVPAPDAVVTEIHDILATGEFVGVYVDSFGEHGFLQDGKKFTPITSAIPGGSTSVWGVNSARQVVGSFFGFGTHGYMTVVK